MSNTWAGICSKCGNDTYMDRDGSNKWCYVCEEEPEGDETETTRKSGKTARKQV